MSSKKDGVHVDDLPADVRSRLGVKKTKSKPLAMDNVRRGAIKVLAAICDHSQRDRERILNHAIKTNKV